MHISRYDSADYGDFFDGKGRLLGHESRDVMFWLNDHPEFTGPIYFEREDFLGHVDVSEFFLPGYLAEDEDEAPVAADRRAIAKAECAKPLSEVA